MDWHSHGDYTNEEINLPIDVECDSVSESFGLKWKLCLVRRFPGAGRRLPSPREHTYVQSRDQVGGLVADSSRGTTIKIPAFCFVGPLPVIRGSCRRLKIILGNFYKIMIRELWRSECRSNKSWSDAAGHQSNNVKTHRRVVRDK